MEKPNTETRGFTFVPNWMCELGLRPSELLAYAVIYGYTANCGSYTGTLAQLAKKTCLTKQGLIKVLARLTELGHITRRKIGKEKKYGSAKYAYFALVNGSPPRRQKGGGRWDVERGSPADETPSNDGGNGVYPINKEINKARSKEYNSPSSAEEGKGRNVTLPGDGESTAGVDLEGSSFEGPSGGMEPSGRTALEAEFDELWALYTRKQGRSEAKRAYLFARKHGETKERVREGLEAYLRRIEREGTLPRFVKQGGNWFAFHRWADGDVPSPPARRQQAEKPANRALSYNQRKYTTEYLKRCGISFDIDDED